jgi:hypothetical protein
MLELGRCFLYIEKLDLNRFPITLEHTPSWAEGLLTTYGPVVDENNRSNWIVDAMLKLSFTPKTISSEVDSMYIYQMGTLFPALEGAAFLFQKSNGYLRRSYPGEWVVQNTSTAGTGARPDLSICYYNAEVNNSGDAYKGALGLEGKTARVCRSIQDGHGLATMPLVGPWLENNGNKIPMDSPDGIFPRPAASANWYPEHWKKKLQKFFFQVCLLYISFEIWTDLSSIGLGSAKDQKTAPRYLFQ